MSVARAKVIGRLDNAGALQEGTVTLDRAGFFSVRPLRRHRVYELPLSTVAEMVVHRILLAEAAERRRAKKDARRR